MKKFILCLLLGTFMLSTGHSQTSVTPKVEVKKEVRQMWSEKKQKMYSLETSLEDIYAVLRAYHMATNDFARAEAERSLEGIPNPEDFGTYEEIKHATETMLDNKGWTSPICIGWYVVCASEFYSCYLSLPNYPGYESCFAGFHGCMYHHDCSSLNWPV